MDDPRFYRAVALEDGLLLRLNVDDYLYIYEELPGIEDMLGCLGAQPKTLNRDQCPLVGKR